jgi:glycosyltransferase involved in cell wall biosynthesis
MRFEKTILQVIPALDAGGAERTTVEMARAIVAAGGRALVATAGGRLAGAVEEAGGKVFILPVASKNLLTIFANRERLARLIRAENVDLIHARSRAPAWSALFAARKTGIPSAATWHGAYDASTPWKRFYNSGLARADLVIANSGFTAAAIRRQYPVGDRLAVIPRGADLEEFNPERLSSRAANLRAEWTGGAPERLVFLLPGRLTPWKGHRIAIEAASLLSGGKAERFPAGARDDFRLIFAGDDQGRRDFAASLWRLVDALGLSEMIRPVGHCDDMAAAYAACDVVLSPSTRPEAFGRVAVEAGAMARPVIGADHGGARETILDGDTGFLAPPGDAPALASAMAKMIALGPVGRRSMGEKARARVADKFSTAAMTAATLGAYDDLLRRTATQ